MNGQRVAFPRYNIKRIFKLRDWLTDDIVSEFSGCTPRGEAFDEMVTKLTYALGKVDQRVIHESVRNVAGTLVTDDVLFRMNWRLAGNLQRLRDGIPVPPWHVQPEKEWVPVQFVSYAPEQNRHGKPGGLYTMRVLAGTACPIRITKFFTTRFAQAIAMRAGYTTLRGKSPFGHPSELVNLRIWVQLDPKFCRPGLPGFDQYGCSSGLKKHNQSIIKKRFRRGWRCPKNYDHHCFECHVGYQECDAATHQRTYQIQQTNG